MRLAFAVAAHLETEILVVDEVLAVGDAQFQKKCLGKMDDIARHGRTVLFISHNMEAIQRLCTRGLLLDRGRLVAERTDRRGRRAVSRRRAVAGRGRPLQPARPRAAPAGRASAIVRLVDDARPAGARRAARRRSGVRARSRARTTRRRAARACADWSSSSSICSDQGQPLLSLMNVDDDGVELPSATACRITARLPARRSFPGRYRLNAFVGIPYLEHVDEIPDALEFEIVAARASVAALRAAHHARHRLPQGAVELRRRRDRADVMSVITRRTSSRREADSAADRVRPPPAAAATRCSSPATNGIAPALAGASTFAPRASAAAAVRRGADVLERLTPDAYAEYVRGFYRAGLERHPATLAVCRHQHRAARRWRPACSRQRYLEIGVRRGRSLAMVASVARRATSSRATCSSRTMPAWTIPAPTSCAVGARARRLHRRRSSSSSAIRHDVLPPFFRRAPGSVLRSDHR